MTRLGTTRGVAATPSPIFGAFGPGLRWLVGALVAGAAIGRVDAAASCTYKSASLPAGQCGAWVDFFDGTEGVNWMNSAGLLNCSRLDPCGCQYSGYGTDYGITCNADGNTIQKISLDNCNLQGMLPESLAAWVDITFFSVSGNGLTGSVPAAVAEAWMNLTAFYVDKNKLSGGALPALPFAQMFPIWGCRLLDYHYGGTNSFSCPWPEGATEVCSKYVQNGSYTGYALVTDSDCNAG